MPSAANIRRYAEIVRERAILRKLVARQRRDRHHRLQPAGPARSTQILDEAESKIFHIGEEGSRTKQGFQSMDTLVVQLIDRVNELHENGAEEVTGVPHRLLRPRPHDRRPAAGRPDHAGGAAVDGQDRVRAQHRRARGACNEGLPVVVFSMEMGASQLALRMVGSLGRIDQQHLRTGAPDATTSGARLTEAVEKLAQASALHRRDARR